MFGFGTRNNRLEQAEAYVESQWTSGLVRHYDARAVCESVEQWAYVSMSPEEAVEVVEKVRARHGWERRARTSYFPTER